VDAAAHTLVRLLTDEYLRNTLSLEAPKGKQWYDWESIARQYADVYDSM